MLNYIMSCMRDGVMPAWAEKYLSVSDDAGHRVISYWDQI